MEKSQETSTTYRIRLLRTYRKNFLLEHTEQDCQDDGKPEQPTQDCKGYLQNNSDNEAQYQEAKNNRNGGYDLRRNYLRDEVNRTDNDGKQNGEFDEACPSEAADLLGRNRLLLDIIGFIRCVCLDEGWCVDILIHDDCIHIGAFNSSRAITRCAGYTKTSVSTNSWRMERSVYLGS